ncbi:hypothetical protein CALVIDRAFT_521792 [Calocera viscosa TUFC12733]|uniref:Uncharacterized protein n=1 Tax=Calocera viscosa (strain TUFC12733) TaxID=1330018 RepID=A0A167H781_CALVF|nr:hypothetical protein CALVIDRAFT_521792 [Calocera viscosa TUFC12733]
MFGLDAYDDLPMEHQAGLKRLYIPGYRIYWHPAIRLHYTTYNLGCGQDYINPNTDHCNVMMLSGSEEEEHPYWYVRVLWVFHVIVSHPESQRGTLQRMDGMFVRWLGSDPEAHYQGGWESSRLDRVGFLPEDDEDTFGFVDPAWAIREAHLCPVFAEGTINELLKHSSLARNTGARQTAGRDVDWRMFYVMRFSDRDMFMRYAGGGVGHGMSAAQGSQKTMEEFSQVVDRAEIDTAAVALAPAGDLGTSAGIKPEPFNPEGEEGEEEVDVWHEQSDADAEEDWISDGEPLD